MPWSDWQFWAVTLAAGVGVLLVARALVPRRKPRPKRTTLTVSAEPKRTGP